MDKEKLKKELTKIIEKNYDSDEDLDGNMRYQFDSDNAIEDLVNFVWNNRFNFEKKL